uniref:Secreted protein n=1 Tax=Streptomyces sp. NBC_00003 TaxID=2903608 RepID=A0AAU2UYM0_9ACTN
MKTTRRAVAVLALAAPILAFAGIAHAAPQTGSDTPPAASGPRSGAPVAGDAAKGGVPTYTVANAVPGGLPGELLGRLLGGAPEMD